LGYLGKRASKPRKIYEIEVWEGLDNQWYWHLKNARNGQILAHSEGYTRKGSAVRVAKNLHSYVLNCGFSILF